MPMYRLFITCLLVLILSGCSWDSPTSPSQTPSPEPAKTPVKELPPITKKEDCRGDKCIHIASAFIRNIGKPCTEEHATYLFLDLQGDNLYIRSDKEVEGIKPIDAKATLAQFQGDDTLAFLFNIPTAEYLMQLTSAEIPQALVDYLVLEEQLRNHTDIQSYIDAVVSAHRELENNLGNNYTGAEKVLDVVNKVSETKIDANSNLPAEIWNQINAYRNIDSIDTKKWAELTQGELAIALVHLLGFIDQVDTTAMNNPNTYISVLESEGVALPDDGIGENREAVIKEIIAGGLGGVTDPAILDSQDAGVVRVRIDLTADPLIAKIANEQEDDGDHRISPVGKLPRDFYYSGLVEPITPPPPPICPPPPNN